MVNAASKEVTHFAFRFELIRPNVLIERGLFRIDKVHFADNITSA